MPPQFLLDFHFGGGEFHNQFYIFLYKIKFFYPRRSLKKNSLYRVKYILRLFCVKILCRKHKNTIHTFFKRFGSKLLKEFFKEEKSVLFFIFLKTYSVWYLDIKFIFFVVVFQIDYKYVVCYFSALLQTSLMLWIFI